MIHRRGTHPSRSNHARIGGWFWASMLLGPVVTIPQASAIWFGNGQVSIITWMGYTFYSIFLFMHASRVHDRGMMILNVSWLTVDLIVLVGILAK